MAERKEAENAGGRVKNILLRIRSGLFRLGEYLLPSDTTCIACGSELKTGDCPRYSLCAKCMDAMPIRSGHYCKICGNAIDEGVLCKSCEIATPAFDSVISPYNYADFPRKMIIAQKEAGATYLFRIVARILADVYTAFNKPADYVCYVPTYSKAVKRRGADHTKRVAELFCLETQIPICHALRRKTERGDQTAFHRSERFENVKGAFALTKDAQELPLNNATVLLIDDVVTTGATASACASLLKGAGAKEVVVVSLARR